MPLPKDLDRMIDNAVRIKSGEPDLALNLSIVDRLRAKPNLHRDAAFALVKHVNGGTAPTALLALSLLDTCVVNLGFPFQLVLSAKDWLNKLVWKFPAEAPKTCHPVMRVILGLLHKWTQALALPESNPAHAADLANFKAMHALLRSKGYRFPSVPEEELAVLRPRTGLQSRRELAAERRRDQEAKLAELLRRARPEDLAAANALIQDMTGYDPEARPDYRAEIEAELLKVRHKAALLDDILGDGWPGESERLTVSPTTDLSALRTLHAECKAALVKIQRMLAEEAGEADESELPLALLLQLNDLLVNVLLKYEDPEAWRTQREEAAKLGASGSREDLAGGGLISLMDLDDDGAVPSGASPGGAEPAPLEGASVPAPASPTVPAGLSSDLADLLDVDFTK